MRSLGLLFVFLLLHLSSPGSEAAPSVPPPPEPSNAEVLGATSPPEAPAPTPQQSESTEVPPSIPSETSPAESYESPGPATPGLGQPELLAVSDPVPPGPSHDPLETLHLGAPTSLSAAPPEPRASPNPDLSEAPTSESPEASDTSLKTSAPVAPDVPKHEPSGTPRPASGTPSSEPPEPMHPETPDPPEVPHLDLSVFLPSEGPETPPPESRAIPSPALPEAPRLESAAPTRASSPQLANHSGTPETPRQESRQPDPQSSDGPQNPLPAAARLLEPPPPPAPPARPRALPRRHGDTVNTIIVVERVQETGVTLVGRPRGAGGGALCLFLAGAGLLLGVFLLLWCLYRRAARSRPFGHHRLPNDSDEPALHLDAPKDPYDLHFYAPDAWVPSHIATKQPPGTPPVPPKLPPPPGRISSPPRLEPLSPAALPNNFM